MPWVPRPPQWVVEMSEGWNMSENVVVPPGQVVYVERRGNGMAVTALVLGILGVLFGLIPLLAPLALIFGLMALIFGGIGLRKAIVDHTGKGMAIAGLVLGAIAFGLSIVGFVILANL